MKQKKINLCLSWHILRSYCFVAEVNFKYNSLAKNHLDILQELGQSIYTFGHTYIFHRSLNSVDWDFVFSNKNVHQQAQYLNKALMNVFTDYTLNKLITIDDKDLPWMNDEIRNKTKERDLFYQQLKKYKLNLTYSDVMNELTLELSIISQRKDNCYLQLVKKLNAPQTNAKTYWSI